MVQATAGGAWSGGRFYGARARFRVVVAGGVDFMLPAGEAVCRSEVADGGMEALGVVVVDEVAGDALGIFKGYPDFRY